MNSLLKILLVFVTAMLSPAGLLRADEETSPLRVIGLFSPDRVEDLRASVATMADVQLARIDFETAEATFRYDVSKLITNFDPKKPPTAETISKRLDDLLRAASNGTFTLQSRAEIPADQWQKIEIKIGVLDCQGCRYGAYLAVAKLDGVERATVSAEKSAITAWIDPAKTDRAALEAALKKARVELPTQ